MRRPARLLPVAGLLLTLQAGVAAAAWSVAADGASAAALDVLAAPSAVQLTWDPVVHASWTASPSPWTTGYRLQRSVSTSGPWSPVAEVGAGTTSVDDSPGAGTHHYRVLAYRGDWTSVGGATAARRDGTYVFKTTSGFTSTGCPAVTGGRFDMQQGWSTAGGTELRRRRSDGGFAFCSDVFTTGQSLPGGTSSVAGWVSNTNGATCQITFRLLVNGTTSLGSGAMTVAQGTRRLQSVSFPTDAHAFATGDRLDLTVSWQENNACNDTYLYWGASGSSSSLTVPA